MSNVTMKLNPGKRLQQWNRGNNFKVPVPAVVLLDDTFIAMASILSTAQLFARRRAAAVEVYTQQQ
jgi:hypothetical protein